MQSLEYKESKLSLKDYLQYLQDKDKNAKLTFNRVFNEWIEKQGIREITKQSYKRHTKPFLAKFGNTLIQDITKNDIAEFLQGYQVSGKLVLCNYMFQIIKRVFNYCVAYDHLEYGVCDRIKYKIIFKLPIVKHHKAIHEKDLKDFVLYSNKALFNDLTIHAYNDNFTKYKTLEYRFYKLHTTNLCKYRI